MLVAAFVEVAIATSEACRVKKSTLWKRVPNTRRGKDLPGNTVGSELGLMSGGDMLSVSHRIFLGFCRCDKEVQVQSEVAVTRRCLRRGDVDRYLELLALSTRLDFEGDGRKLEERPS